MIHVQKLKSPDQRWTKILQTISLQDYVKRLWNHSNTKIPITIGKGTDSRQTEIKSPARRGNEYSAKQFWSPGAPFTDMV